MEALRERFGKYHVLEKIAQGGMAEVYKVKTVGIAGFEKVQALKRILPRQAREGRFIRSFIDEARIAVELTHRNIVQVFDFGKADGELFLAMELIEGKDLRAVMAEAVAKDSLPSAPVAAYIISEVALGLDYAHRKDDGHGGSLGIVHCDVSPSNVMISTEGDIKILDFGIARATFASALERRRLRGKPRYMAPEQTIGETPSAASDVFALGIIAWELLTGMPLFRGPDLKSILEAVRRTDPPRCDRINPKVPKEIADAVATALSREPSQRGTTADLASACARTALAAGARVLARWMAQLDGRPSLSSMDWQPSDVGSVSAPPGAKGTDAVDSDSFDVGGDVGGAAPAPAPSRKHATPPARPSMTVSLRDAAIPPMAPARPAAALPRPKLDEAPARPSVTVSLRDIPIPSSDPGEGRAPHVRGMPTPPRPLPGVAPMREPTTTSPRDRQFERDVSTTQVRRYEPPPASAVQPTPTPPTPPTPPTTPPTPDDQRTRPVAQRYEPRTVPAAQRFDPSATVPATPSFGPEATVAGHAKLVDALPPEPARQPRRAATAVETRRRSYEKLELAPGARPSALRFDDDDTHHSFELPQAVEDTSYDELASPADLEASLSAEAPLAEPLAEAPIDDDLGAMAAGGLADRRRIVLVAGVLSGAPIDALRPISKSLGELAYQRGGVVLELARDGLLVAFGLEVAGEDDVAIAMGWALDAAAMARDAAVDGHAPVLQIGARTGVATSSSGGPVAPTVTVARADTTPQIPRDAIDEARALAREAAPDRPLFVGGAGRVTSSLYELRELPADRRVTRQSRVIEVVGPRGFEERVRARLERRGRFVGRTQQLAELDAWLARSAAGNRRSCVLLTGPAGAGKSRLVAELIARHASAPLQVTTTQASPASRLTPFSTIIDVYQSTLGMRPSRGRNARAEVVRRLLRLMERHGMAPERARVIATDLDRAMELRDGLGVAAREVSDLRPRISAGIAAFRTAIAGRERPALTIVEDIHLADSASVEVLRHTLGMPAVGPELLLLTMRPEGPPPPVTDAVLTLGDLVGGELRALIVDRLGDAATPMAIAAVLARGGGNPLFVEELAQAVRDAGPAGASGEDVPASARDVVSARIDRLSAKAKAALRFASVIGGTVRVRVLEELLGEDSLERELDELVAAGFLARSDGAAGASEGELAFARGLVREVVYESLSARAQRETHARVGRLLASRFFAGREEPPATIAEHLERGGEAAGAAAFWLRAGRLAMSASDAGAAIACFTRTLGLERELGVVPPTETSKARRREALAGREEAHRLQGDLAADAGDLDQLEQLCVGEPAQLADVSIRRAQRMLRLGDYPRASDATIAAEDYAVSIGDDRMRGEALRVRGEILERVGRFDEALAVVGTARELFHRQHAVADEMAAMVGRGRIHLLRAHYEAARDAYHPVLEMIAQTRDPWLERIVMNHVAVIEMCLGNFSAAMRSAERSLELCRRYGDRGREGDALSVAGIVLLEVGLYDQAAGMFEVALDILSRTNSRWSRADCLIYAGTCELLRGHPAGLRMLDEALDEARRLGARYLEANALVTRAGAQLRAGALGAAIADASAGSAVARSATLLGYEIQGVARHALALSRIGHRDAEAVALVQHALAAINAQKYLEGSEEEVLLACAEVLERAGAPDHGRLLRDHGRASALRKLNGLDDPAWRAAYAAVPEIAALIR